MALTSFRAGVFAQNSSNLANLRTKWSKQRKNLSNLRTKWSKQRKNLSKTPQIVPSKFLELPRSSSKFLEVPRSSSKFSVKMKSVKKRHFLIFSGSSSNFLEIPRTSSKFLEGAFFCPKYPLGVKKPILPKKVPKTIFFTNWVFWAFFFAQNIPWE